MRIATIIKHNCIICGDEFELKKSQHQRKTCDEMCRKIYSRQVNASLIRNYKHTGKFVICPVCGDKTYRYQAQIRQGYKNYCSKKCWYSVMKPGAVQIQALHDNRHKRDYSDPISRAKLSATQKRRYETGQAKPRYGADNNFWKGGIATLQNQLRQTAVYKEWRKQVYQRDNFTCQHCRTNKDLHAHHIKTFSKYPDLRYEVSNGITLCRPCHGKVHGRYLPDIARANKKS